MKGWLVYTEADARRNQSYIHWFLDEAQKQSITLTLLLREYITIGIRNQEPVIIYDGRQIETADFAVIRTMDPLLSSQFKQMNIQLFNPAKISETFNHKGNAYLAIQSLGIPVPETYLIAAHAVPADPPMKFPFVCKMATGRGGTDVKMLQTRDDWQAYREACTTDFVVQSPYMIEPGKDLRVFIIGRKIVGAVLRSNKNDFRANYSLGGTAAWYTLNRKEKAIIQKIIHAYDFGLAGIDFMFSTDGELVFNEIEDVVGSRTLSMVSEINLLREYVDFIKHKLN